MTFWQVLTWQVMDPSKGRWELQKTPRMLDWHCAGEAQNILGCHFRLRWEETVEGLRLGLFCLVAEACSA